MKFKNLLSIFAVAMVVLLMGCSKDDDADKIAPTVISSDPANNAIDVVLNKTIIVKFSEAMKASTINNTSFTLKNGQTAVTGVVTYSEETASFAPSSVLTASTVYTVTVSTQAENLKGTGLEENKVWSFTTGVAADAVLPTIISTSPINNKTDVVRNTKVEVTFSEKMDPLTINENTFTLKQGENLVAGNLEYNGTLATFTPTNTLLANKKYTATITTGAKDLAGNALTENKVWGFTTVDNSAGIAGVKLGSAGNYVILAKTAINNSPTSNITGDLGLSPAATSYITGLSLTDFTGYATSTQVSGQIFAADMATPTPINLTTAVENMITAYNDAAGRPTPDFLELGTGNIGGKTLSPGLYKWTSTVTLPADVTISGGAGDVWIFQISGDLNMSAAVKVILEEGAQAKNIFWQIAGEATFGATSHFEGTILSMTGITFQTGASFNGRALAQTAVTLDSNTIVGK